VNWTWKEFFVIGIQWASIYHPALWCAISLIFSLLLAPQVSAVVFKDQFTYKSPYTNGNQRTFLKSLVGGFVWLFVELARVILVWFLLLVYTIYLVFLPWLFGHPITEDSSLTYMTHRGWILKTPNSGNEVVHAGIPDVMVIVLPHLYFVLLPTVVILAAMAAERTAFREHYLSRSGKKKDDYYQKSRRQIEHENFWNGRWIRKFLCLLCLVVLWKHWKV
jgi:hypothetical protein